MRIALGPAGSTGGILQSVNVGIGGTFTSPKITLGVKEAAEQAVKNVVDHPAFRNSARMTARLYDALHDMMDAEMIPKLMAAGVIEVAPLAFMRGRTLNDAFVILDEAQNTTAEQMKMFLTRLGFGSKIVVTGDVTQIDLPGGMRSGLRSAVEVLDGIEDIHIAELTSADVVRHKLVSEIVDAYEAAEAKVSEHGLANRAHRRSTGRTRR